MEDVAVYGYITPLKMRIVLVLALSDAAVRDTDIITVGNPLIFTTNCFTLVSRSSRHFTWLIMHPCPIPS
jgi:hypothetical protein